MNERIVKAAIHPGIGIARVGNSEDFFIGPEVLDPLPMEPGFMRDCQGKLKRQAARFRIYGFDETGNLVKELTLQEAGIEIEWRVKVANTKSSWFAYDLAMDIDEAKVKSSGRRNGKIEDRSSLEIRPSERSISGRDRAGASYRFDDGKFLGKQIFLGELRTDDLGRLLFLGGFGHSSAETPDSVLDNPCNNDGWHDDIADGYVHASVTIDGRPLEVVEGAWVASAPPNFAPELRSIRTLRDVIEDLLARSGETKSDPVSFERHILPILRRQGDLQWVNKAFAIRFGWKGELEEQYPTLLRDLADSSDTTRELRQLISRKFRRFDSEPSAQYWPWIYGDAMEFEPKIMSPRQYMALTSTQLGFLDAWAEGNFVTSSAGAACANQLGDIPLAEQPRVLDEAAMDFCIADAFCPGCELTWPMRHATLYSGPYRILEAKDSEERPVYGEVLTSEEALKDGGMLYAQRPGDLTRWMGVPWQADTASCSSGYVPSGYGEPFDSLVPSFWPARVPNHVLSQESYDRLMDPNVPLTERLEAFNDRSHWKRTLGSEDYKTQLKTMVTHFSAMGVVTLRQGPGDVPGLPPSMMVEERLGTSPAAPVEPSEPAAVPSSTAVSPRPPSRAIGGY